MSKIPYTKQALTFDEQIQHLRRRGMVFADVNQARDYLGHINYYRLAAYWLPFEADHASHQFEPGTTFEPLPPIWASVEIMTLGQLSKWYANLKLSADRNRIANAFDFDEVNLVSFMHHLAIVRNVCAHHSRLWNREFAFTFKLPRRRPATVLGSLNPEAPKKLYNTLVVLACLLDAISPLNQWKQKLISLIQAHHIPEHAMGFPVDWQGQPIWK
jgi:abortive infection bacteriophage resistance protein